MYTTDHRPDPRSTRQASTGQSILHQALRRVTIAATLATAVLASACATDDPHRRAKTGAVVGAAVGAIAGNQTSSRNGKFVGAAIGAITGAAVGNYMDGQQRKLEQRLAAERASNDIRLTRIDEETLRIDLNSAATFAVNSAGVRSDFRASLAKVANVIEEYDRTAVHVIGHTDDTGTETYNQQLSEKRADSVTRYLVQNGVVRDRTRATGRGETAPIDSNATSSGRSRNRRVEIYLKPIVKGRENEAFRSPGFATPS